MANNNFYGIIGNPISHSLSPSIYNFLFAFYNIDAIYVSLQLPKNEKDFMKAINGLLAIENFKGANVTAPFKERILKYGESTDIVKQIGAANVIKVEDNGKAILYNTDWIGFLKHIQQLVDLKNKRALILGTGGVARAIIYALQKTDTDIYIWDRKINKAKNLAKTFNVKYLEKIETLDNFDILINATPVTDKPLFDYDKLLHQNLSLVYDVNYNDSLLVKTAQEKNINASDGLMILIYQAIENFQIWTGKTIEDEMSDLLDCMLLALTSVCKE